MNTIVVNLFGEPGAGKSTAAMDITAKLKRAGINAEYVSEYAKDKVYEEDAEVFKHQEYLFGKQSFKIGRVCGRVQVIVTDAPLVMSVIYNQNVYLGKPFECVVMSTFNAYRNKNYLLLRKHKYEDAGRFQNETQATDVREKLIAKLKALDVKYECTTSSDADCKAIVESIIKEIQHEQ